MNFTNGTSDTNLGLKRRKVWEDFKKGLNLTLLFLDYFKIFDAVEL